MDFRLPAGGVLLIIGPSGSGKSTLARAIAGLVPGDFLGTWTGSLRVGDLETSTGDRLELATAVGILFQDPGSQLVMDRVADDVAFGLENRGWPLEAMREAVPAALADAGLPGFERRRGSRLSGGEQQRLALAGVLAARPSVLVADEPTANLDPSGAAAIFEVFARIKAAGEATLVLVEHHADVAWPLADLVLALDGNGTLIAVGPPAKVLARSRKRLVEAGIWLPGDAASMAKSGRGSGTGSAGDWAGRAPLVETRDLRYAYERGRPVVRDVHLRIGAGERVALVGPNGSGKSTLLRLLSGLLRPSGGIVRLNGRDPGRLSAGRLARLAGFVFQDPELGFIENTVADEAAVGLESRSIDELMLRLGLPLDSFGTRSPYRLSGGEQRRLSVATALARSPSLLLLDEPTFGQDRRGWEAIAQIIDELVETGTTVIAATHDLAFARRIATRHIEMGDGWIVADEQVGAEAPAGLSATDQAIADPVSQPHRKPRTRSPKRTSPPC
ncbi:MAG: ATP-binding cassette domain-containing protein [Chloroflexota bacterium]